MLDILKRLTPGILILTTTSAVLLLSDTPRRHSGDADIPRIAILQHASQEIIDEGVDGMLAGLRRQGFVSGRSISIRRYNAENDVATANAIAKEIASRDFDLVLTATTLSLQAFANANRAIGKKHVFALVTDPAGAGVGISRDDPLDHPSYMAGYGTMQPMAEALDIARRMYPGLRSLGMAWNPAEANSEATTKLARKACRKAGVELIEAPVENTAGVAEAVRSLIARGADALWIGGDVTVTTAIDTVVAAARKAGIPVFTNLPGDAKRGALFDVGANYFEVGRLAGELAGRILKGLDPATVPIENLVPEKILINRDALRGLKDPWHVPRDLLAKAELVGEKVDVDAVAAEEGQSSAPITPASRPRLSKTWQVDILEYVDIVEVEDAQRGILDGLADAGLIENEEYRVRVRNAQGDMATLPALVDTALAEDADLIMPLSTPTLQATLQRVRDRPIVFTLIANPLIAGAGRTNQDHRPNVTGVSTLSAYAEVVAMVSKLLPAARRVGTVIVPSEVNMVYNKDQVGRLLRDAGIELVEVAANTSAEVTDAAAALCSREIDAVVQVAGNITTTSFTAIHRAAERAGLPAFGFMSSNARDGAAVVVARDYYDAGREAGSLAARVMRGENPADIPFRPVQKTRLLINMESARAVGLTIPPAILAQAATVIGE